jgi:hypothetical protein
MAATTDQAVGGRTIVGHASVRDVKLTSALREAGGRL